MQENPKLEGIKPREILVLAAYALGYLGLLLTGILFSPGPGSISLFWPANGFLIAVLAGDRPALRRPLMALCAGAIFAVNMALGASWAPAAGFALANFSEAAVAVWLIGRIEGGHRFLGNLKGTLRFFFLAIPVSAGISAGIGAPIAAWFFGGSLPGGFITWFLADAAGIAVVAPMVLAWKQPFAWESRGKRYAEFAACLAGAVAFTYVTFARPAGIWDAAGHPQTYLAIPFLVWAALRFGVRGAATVHLCIYAMSAWFTSRGLGPFSDASAGGVDHTALQLFPFAASFCALVPAVLIEAQRRTEAALLLRESRYGNLWNSKLIGIYVADLKGRIVEANATMLGMIGATRREMEDGSIEMLKMATPEYIARIGEIREAFIRDGQVGPFEREWVLKDGSRFSSLTYASRMDESDRALGMVMDIGELKTTQKELRRRESRYRDISSSSLIGIFVTDLQGVVREANDTFLAMIRRGRAEMEAGTLDVSVMAPPDYVKGAPERREIFRKEGRMGPLNRQWLLDDGSVMNTLFFATRMEEGTDALCMVVNTDDLNRTRQELRAVESRFKTMFDSNIIGVAVVRGDMVFEEANDAYLSLIGYDREELRNGSLHAAMLQAPDAPDYKAYVDESLKTRGKFDPQERIYKRKDGSLVHVYRGMARLDGSDRILIVAIDLTESKRAQAAMEEAKRAAEEANEAKSDFLAHMSHEIRTPLNGVMGMLSLLLETELTPEQAGYALASKESGTHLMSLINQVLDFSKIGSGHGDLDSSEFSLEAIIEGAFASVLELAQKKGIVIVPRLDPDVPDRLIGDPVRLQQVLLNLIGNAVKFTEAGGIRLSIRLLERDAGNCRLHFEVADQGPGLTAQTMDRLFQPFRQGDASLARKAGGTGLGLAISKELVERMGGRIWVESEPGKGSSFQFTARLGLAGAGETAGSAAMGTPEERGTAAARTAQAPPNPPPWKTAPRVLVVDDHPVNLTVASAMLRKMGCEVETVMDSATALSAVSSSEFDIVFMDCQMPGMDGFEATRRIRSLEGNGRHVPIIALTAHAVAGVREKCLAEGMDDYISKPFTREEIGRAVLRWVPPKDGGEPSGPPVEAEAGAGAESKTGAAGAARAMTMDWARLQALSDGTPQGEALVKKLIFVYIDTSRAAMEALKADIAKGRGDFAARSLHKLKGGSGTVGALAVYAQVEAMEGVLKGLGQEAGTGTLLQSRLMQCQEKLEAVFAETCEELRRRN